MALHYCKECHHGFPRKSDLSKTSKLCNPCATMRNAEEMIQRAIPGSERWEICRSRVVEGMKNMPIDPTTV